MANSTAEEHARTIWSMRLHSALRTAFACAIVGLATLRGPTFLVNQLKFSSFSYLTVVLIMTNPNPALGHALRGCWHAFYASVQVVPLAVLGRWLLFPVAEGGFPAGMAAVVAAAATFLVVVVGPESTAKRIALGQIALVCTDVVISSDHDNISSVGYMRPIYVATCTALGALACLLALLLPFPGLAHCKVQKLCQVYAENATKRLDIYLKAFNGQDHHAKTQLILQAKPISQMGTKLLLIIKNLQEALPWERPWRRYSKNNLINIEKRLKMFELPIRAMEYSLISSPYSFPIQTLDREQLISFLKGLTSNVQNKIDEISSPSNSRKPQQTSDHEPIKNPSIQLESIVQTHSYKPACFFFSCIDILVNDAQENNKKHEKTELATTQILKLWILNLPSSEKLETAFKYSISLGLSVLLGLILEKENACWASLIVATSFTSAKEAIFTTANLRAQGTAAGSVYGVICCILFHNADIRLIALLPWIIFTTFLKHSKIYGPIGSNSAAIGALIILGRKDYGPESEFAIDRLTSVFIGLFCLVLVEVFLQPIRAATLAKKHLCLTLFSLQDCLRETYIGEKNHADSKFQELREKQRNLDSLVCKFRKFVTDADSEPDFWYLPLHSCSYKKLVGSLYNLVHMLYFVIHNLQEVSELENSGIVRTEFQERLNYELELLQETVNSSLEKVSLVKLPEGPRGPIDDNLMDLEAGKMQNSDKLNDFINEEALRITEENDSEDEKKCKERIIRCMGAIGFCITFLRKEIDEIEICIREIVRWENSSSQ